MAEANHGPQVVRFGVFEVELRAGELRKGGVRLKLQEQPFQLLALLLERPGEVVTREDLRQKLWSADTFVDFDHGLNTAISKLREALGDTADSPRYVETVPRRGYRFIAPVERQGAVSRRQLERWQMALLLLGLALAVAIGAGLWLRGRQQLGFRERDWVLIADFENRTGDPIFSDSLEYALERELVNSAVVNVVPRERVNDALRLMKRPLDTRITPTLAREICLRDGNIRALLEGRVEKLGPTYLLSLAIVDPARGVSVGSNAEEAGSQQQILPATRRLSNWVRKTLGEQLASIQASSQKLEQATTPSLRALQLYSQGMVFLNAHNWGAAAQLLEAAVTQDPDFASAHIYLAGCYDDMGKQEKAALHYRRALVLAETTSDRERYFILGSYYQFTGEVGKAKKAYEVLVQLYPDHYWGVGNLAALYESLGEFEQALAYIVHRAELRPNDFQSNARAWFHVADLGNDTGLAQRYLLRARKLASAENEKSFPIEASQLEISAIIEAWNQKDAVRLLSETERVTHELPSKTGPMRDALADQVCSAYGNLGKFRAAENFCDQIGDPAWHFFNRMYLAFFKEDKRKLGQELDKWVATRGPSLDQFHGVVTGWVFLAARGGRPELAGKWFRHLEKQLQARRNTPQDRALREGLAGIIALARGEKRKGISSLEEALSRHRWTRRSANLYRFSESLAQALEEQGDFPKAIHVLEDLPQGNFNPSGPDWLRTRAQLARLYRKAGRVQDAEKVEAELKKLLVYADPDHPLLLQLKRLAGPVDSRSRK